MTTTYQPITPPDFMYANDVGWRYPSVHAVITTQSPPTSPANYSPTTPRTGT